MASLRPIILLLVLACSASQLAIAKPATDVPATGRKPTVIPFNADPIINPRITPQAHDEGLAIAERLKVGMTPEEVEPILGKFDRFAWPLINRVREKCQQGRCSIEVEVYVGAVEVRFAADSDRVVRAKAIRVLPATP